MDTKLALVKTITLLYLESLIRDQINSSAEFCRKIIESSKSPEEKLSIGEIKDVVFHLKTTATSLIEFSQTQTIDKDDLLQRLRVNCAGEEELYFSLEKIIDQKYTPDELKQKVVTLRQSLADMVKEDQVGLILKKAYQEFTWGRDKITSLRDFVLDLSAKLDTHKTGEKKKDPAVVADVDFSNLNAVSKALEEMKEEHSSEGIMRTGWKAVNVMLQGGFRRGEFWIMPALQHSYKTGSTLTFFKQIAMYNKPYMIYPNKKPLLLRISFEDTMPQNLRYLSENISFNKTKEMPDLNDTPVEKMAKEIMEKMTIGGYSVIMRRVDASRWTYQDLFGYILQLESEGYEIHLCMLDYLSLLPTTGCVDGPSGVALRDLFRRSRAFFSAKKITVITPHQLSTEAKQLVRDGHGDFLNQIAGRGYFADSKQLDQEVDGELYFHIVKFNKRAYLWIKRCKHRGVPVIKEDLLDAFYPFPEIGPIVDDLETHRIDLSRIGGKVIPEEGEVAEEAEEMMF